MSRHANALKIGDVVKHVNNRDIAYRIDKPPTRLPHKVRLRTIAVNQGFVSTYCINERVKIDLTPENTDQWLVCDEPLAECIRYVQWSPLKF
jgi:hypothetical protein